jgi:competence protein ComEA
MTFDASKPESAPGSALPESTEVGSSSFEGGGRDAAPASEPSPFARLQACWQGSVWAPVALKALGIGLGMLALSGIGAASILWTGQGFDLAHADARLQKDIHGAWLAGSEAPKPPPAPPRSAQAPNAPAPPASSASPAPGSGGTDRDAAAVRTSPGLTADGKIILNLATADELRRLPGVGAKRARAIVELRTKLGRFKLTDLLRVRGIGAKSLRRMQEHLILDPPAGSS